MIQSMTGYGKAAGEYQGKNYIVEVRSLNSKNLDLNVRLPQHLRPSEMEWRKLLAAKLTRGKCELFINMENTDSSSTLNVDKLKNYLHELRKVQKELGIGESDLITAAMRIPDLYQTAEELEENEQAFVQGLIEEAAKKFTAYRTDEGVGLAEDLSQNIKAIQALLEKVPSYEEERIANIKTKLRGALEEKFEAKDVDENRFEQELIYYIEKIDISEEKQRLSNHLKYFLDTMDLKESQGKKLNFISQEIGREINTLGSKSYHVELQKIVVQMKDHLEKIKEQVLNTL